MAMKKPLHKFKDENLNIGTTHIHPHIDLKNNGIKTRPALGEITNRDLKINDQKSVLKKPTNVLKKTVITTKLSEVIKPVEKVKEEKKLIPLQKKEITPKKLSAYSVQHLGLIEENDTDPLLVPLYINDIITHLRNLELEYMIHSTFMVAHKTTSRMRSVLINWLVEVHLNFRMVQETLYLCVSIIDRYLDKNKTVGRDNLQLVGIAALFVASKYEETYAPDIADLVYVCDDIFTKKRIIKMEQSILKTLKFRLGNPCSLHFLRRYSKVAKVEQNHHILAKYLLESALLQHEFTCVKPSLLAGAACCMSVQLLEQSDKNCDIQDIIYHVSGYSKKEIAPVIKNLASMILKLETTKYQAVKIKYASRSNSSISSRTELKNGLIKKLAQVK